MNHKPFFMGFKLPDDISYEAFPQYVDFYRKNSFDEWNMIGYILLPYSAVPLEYWEKELKKILK